VSSSSSTDRIPAPSPVATQLARAFALLAGEVPSIHTEVAARLGTVRVRLTVDDEVFDVANIDGAPRVIDAVDDASVTIATTQAVVRDVLAGGRTMAEVVRDDALRALGPLRDLVAVLAALDAFVHGAIRCHAMSALFDEFQTERVA
jgi:hypothetical protein